MAKFPVYNICNLNADNARGNDDILVENLAGYLNKHYKKLHFPHRHSFYHIVVFTKGRGSHTIDFKTFPVKAGQAYFMIPGQVHTWDFKAATEGYIINFSESYFKSFLLAPNYLDRFSFFNGSAEDGVLQLNAATLRQVALVVEEMLQLPETSIQRSDLIKVLVLKFLLTVEAAAGEKPKATVPQQKTLMFKNFRNLIEKNYRDLKLPNEYAALMYITPHHLNALCQDLSGRSAGELIRDRVLLEAKRLLVNEEMTATQIATELNFKDASYFNRFFKKATAITPFEFRKQINKH